MDLSPIWLTLKLAAITTLLLLIAGLPIAWWLSKGRSFFKTIIEAIITMPLVLPPSVLGFYLLLAFSPQHGLGKWLQDSFDTQFVFSFKGLVLASFIYSMPFMTGPIISASIIHARQNQMANVQKCAHPQYQTVIINRHYTNLRAYAGRVWCGADDWR
jgi:ABC-type molybdate transport system permease subunit